MSDSPETLTNVPSSHPAEDLDRTFSRIQEELETETHRSVEQRNGQMDALREREQLVEECLSRARAHYQKKEYPRAFAEWEKICTFLPEQDEFRKKVAALKESHENLTRVNRELTEIKGMLSQRSSPPAGDRKFVQEAHAQTTAQVKNVYGHLNQQLRAERTPKTLSFWWPVVLGLVLVGIGYAGFSTHFQKVRREWTRQAEKSGAASLIELTTAEAQRDEALRTNESLRGDYERQIAELKQQNAGWRDAGREKISTLENRVKELETENGTLKRRIETLVQENLSR